MPTQLRLTPPMDSRTYEGQRKVRVSARHTADLQPITYGRRYSVHRQQTSSRQQRSPLKQLYTVQGATKDRILPTLRTYPASTDFILDLIFWKALVWMESDVFTVDDRIPNPRVAAQAFDKEQITLLCGALAAVSAALV